jgi:hypothetical protein
MASSMGGGVEGRAPTALAIYKLYADGREELVRGMEIAPLTATSFKDILAAGDQPGVYHGAYVPLLSSIFAVGTGGSAIGNPVSLISCVAPSLLFEEVSLKKSSTPAPVPPVVGSPLARESSDHSTM